MFLVGLHGNKEPYTYKTQESCDPCVFLFLPLKDSYAKDGLLKNLLKTGKGYMELRQNMRQKCCIPYTGMLYLKRSLLEVK